MEDKIIKRREEKSMHIAEIRSEVRRICGIRLNTPKDYDELAQLIYEKTRYLISTSTLKRFMGYLPGKEDSASISTLDILSRYLGHTDFPDYAASKKQGQALKPDLGELKLQLHSMRMQLSNLAQQIENMEERL